MIKPIQCALEETPWWVKSWVKCRIQWRWESVDNHMNLGLAQRGRPDLDREDTRPCKLMRSYISQQAEMILTENIDLRMEILNWHRGEEATALEAHKMMMNSRTLGIILIQIWFNKLINLRMKIATRNMLNSKLNFRSIKHSKRANEIWW